MKESGGGGRKRELAGVREVLEGGTEIEGREILVGGSEELNRKREVLGDMRGVRGGLGDMGGMRGDLVDTGGVRGVLGKGCIVGREGQVLLITRSTRRASKF